MSKDEKKYSLQISQSTLKLAAVLLIGLIVGYTIGAGFGAAQGEPVGGTSPNSQLAAQQTAQQGQAQGSRIRVSTDNSPSVGPKDAKVTVIEFSDFQCPFCKRAFPAVQQMLKDYNGKIRFVYRNFPLSFHVNAEIAAEAALCANEQGKFWEYHDKIFEVAQADGTGLDANSLKEYAKGMGLDAVTFNSCLDTKRYASVVQKDEQDGTAAGVSGTPTFFIGNEKNGYIPIVGAQPYIVLKQAIDSELSQ